MSASVTIPDNFSDLTIATAKTLRPTPVEVNLNRPFIEGDHFQQGKGWVGPGPKESDPQYGDFLRILEPSFISKNVVDEGCDRLTGAVIGWEPRWAWVPIRHDTVENPMTPEETAAINELESSLTTWWDTLQVHKLVKRLIYRMLWAKESAWRLYTPGGLLGEGGSVKSKDLADALSKIYLDIPEPENAFVFEHPDTRKKVGVVIYKDAAQTEHVEFCFLEKDGQTTIKILPESKVEGETNSATNDFGGHLSMFMVSIDQPLVTEQIRALQRAYNTTLTLLQKGLADNHFLERLFMNAMPPGHWEFDSDGKTRKNYVVAKRVTGGKVDSYIQGVDYQQPDGTTELATPSVTIRQPLDPVGTIGGCEYWYQTLLESLRQDHVLINQLATPSGKSREHSRGDFIDSTKNPVMQANLAGRELLVTVVSMAEAFMGSPGKWTKKFKPVFQCRPNYGPLSVAERQQNVIESEKGYLSDETVMALNGTDDVDAEQALIQSQPRAFLALSSSRADVVNKWSTDFPREVALFMAGYTDKEIKEIMARVGKANSLDPNDPAPPPAPVAGGKPPVAANA